MRNIKKWAALVLCFFLMTTLSAQTKKLDKLEMLYDQGNYEIVYRKAKRYLNTPEYDLHATPAFYKALAAYKMYTQGDKKYTVKKSIKLYEDFLKKQPVENFMAAHNSEIIDFKNDLIIEVQRLKELDKTKQSKLLLANINTLFDENQQYANITVSSKASNNKKTKESKNKTSKNKKENTVKPALNNKDIRNELISYSEQFIGTPYKWGGTDPKGFDCSGFTSYVMKAHGYDLPRIAGDQYKSGQHISLKQAKKGDLVFFGSKHNVQHVGLVVSEPGEELKMIHASSSRGIMISNIEKSSYWKPKLLYASRVIKK